MTAASATNMIRQGIQSRSSREGNIEFSDRQKPPCVLAWAWFMTASDDVTTVRIEVRWKDF